MALDSSRLSTEPLMDTTDKLAAQKPVASAVGAGQASRIARPFGLRFAVSPARCGKHEKTYYTVTVEKTTHINRDGRVDTETDYVQKERRLRHCTEPAS